MTLQDLHHTPDPAVEVHGAMLKPMMVHRYGPPEVVANPAPFVATSVPEQFAYTAAKTGATAVPGPRKSLNQGAPAPEMDSGALNPWAAAL